MFWPNHNVAKDNSRKVWFNFAQQFQQTGIKCEKFNSTERTQPDDESSTGFGHVKYKWNLQGLVRMGHFESKQFGSL